MSEPSNASPFDAGAAKEARRLPYLLREPGAILPWLCATTSISTLLLYLAGVVELIRGGSFLLLPGLLLFAFSFNWAKRRGKRELLERLLAGCWAGLAATFTYDVVRVPLAMAGLPVFKAISYFGTVFLAQPSPTLASEIVGWMYHLSNGVGFALMYTLWVRRPRWWTAVFWGLVLEGVMLLTPYAEVFGYKVSRQFLAITIGAHVFYGLGLWGAWKFRSACLRLVDRPAWYRYASLAVWMGVPLGLAVIAADFHARHARRISASPPDYIGPHLYTTWDVLEPDRLAAMWVWKRFVDAEARFHFVPAFSRITLGVPFDTPEATVRRTGTRSATEVLLARHQLDQDPKLLALARMTHVHEITPWMIGPDVDSHALARKLKDAIAEVPEENVSQRAHRAFAWLETWYLSDAAAGLVPLPGDARVLAVRPRPAP